MIPLLIPAEEVRTGDLMEDHDRTWRPVTHIDNPPQMSAWFFYRVSAQGVRMHMRGSLVMVCVGRDDGKAS